MSNNAAENQENHESETWDAAFCPRFGVQDRTHTALLGKGTMDEK